MQKKINALQEESKVKLKAGDKGGAKRILAKKRKCRSNKTNRRCNGNDGRAKIYVRRCRKYKRYSIVSAIKQGNSAVKEETKVMRVEELDEMKGEMEDLKAGQEEY